MLVVGNGALGLFLAEELAARGAGKVTVVGAPGRPGGASKAAGAMLGCFGEVTKDTLRTPAGRAKFGISLAAHKRWPEVLERLRHLATERGESLRAVADTFVILNACGGELDSLNFAAMLSAMDEMGEPWSEAEPGDIRSYQPRTDARALRVVHLPNEGAVDGNQVLSLMETSVERAGARLVPGEVRSLEVADGRVTGVRLADGTVLSAGTVVVAAGVRSADLVRPVLGRDELLPMFAGAGVAFVGRRERGEGFTSVVRSPNRSGSCGLHLVPFGDGREYLGATNILYEEPQLEADVGMGRFLSECAMQQLDERICFHKVVEWRTGNRPVTLDGFPAVGWTSVAGLYLLTGTYRDGFHCAPVLAEHVAGEVLGTGGTLDMPFAPDRSPIWTWSPDGSADEFALHMMAGWFEARAVSPPEVTAATLGDLFRTQASAVCQMMPAGVGLGPEILMYLTGPHADRERLVSLLRYLRHAGAAA
ncbi:NAD(P)/FAD-dependent oxidoreductase [Micromonospora sp. CPCC 206061]|uniref:NAD(P)/FAD-dependent oxidoreductase n=1 Tax=Micromonospora sp. CPCC 206061 TaxID=3122410 RepID=UPI002FF05885